MSCGKLRALVVEDHPIDAEILAARLARSSFDLCLTHVDRLQEALGQLDQNRFDLVFLDLSLPDSDGLETLVRLQKHTGRPAIIVMTSTDDENAGAIAVQAGAQDYLIKGQTDNRSLHRSIRYALERQRLTNELTDRTRDLVELNNELTYKARERQDCEKILHERERQLLHKQKMEAVGILAGGVAHEFNNLLQAIRGYTSFASEGLLADEQRYLDLQQVLKATDQAAALTRQLLGFSRSDELPKQRVAIGSIVHEALALLKPLIGAHIDVQVDTQRCTAEILGEPTLIQQLLLNLCVNARDAMPGGGTLSIRAEDAALDERHPANELESGHYAVVTVADTGCGMPPEVQRRIFEPFFTTKAVGEGTGLGLSVVYNIVRQHEGMLQVESLPGQGSTFKLFLPLASCGDIEKEEVEEHLEDVGGTETILLAEDDSLVREVTARILRSNGYHVLVACDGEEAVRLFEQKLGSIDLTVLDMVMPKFHGKQVALALQALKPDTKIVFCSGHDRSEESTMFLEGCDFIQKPFHARMLLQAVRTALNTGAVSPFVKTELSGTER